MVGIKLTLKLKGAGFYYLTGSLLHLPMKTVNSRSTFDSSFLQGIYTADTFAKCAVYSQNYSSKSDMRFALLCEVLCGFNLISLDVFGHYYLLM